MELWVDVKGFEGHYQVSNMGRVRSLDRKLMSRNGRNVFYRGTVLKPVPNSQGYLRVELKKPKKLERWFVHRLVAVHFVKNDNPQVNTIVNHLDSNPQNNAASNLEWTTLSGNVQHALGKGRLKRTETWIARLNTSLEKLRKPVVGCDPVTGETVIRLRSVNECAKHGYESSSVCMCCQGKRKTHKGLVWRYATK